MKRNVSRIDVFAAIDSEIEFAESFYVPKKRYQETHTLGEFILMLEQYAAQARHKWTHHGEKIDGYPDSLHEVRKIAALAARCMSQHGAPRREFPNGAQPKTTTKTKAREAAPKA